MTLANLSISAQLILDLHSLNNEGGEGNQIQTRMVNIVDGEGELHNVNAISGDMFKHIQAEHLFQIAREEELPLSAGARVFDANRINADEGFNEYIMTPSEESPSIPAYNDATVIDYLLQQCSISDIEGILITTKKKGQLSGRSIPRKSVVEFGWVVGVPEHVQTDSYFHVKYQSDNSKTKETRDAEEGSNLGQSIFHRPASSGVYAVVCHLNLARIGFNDILQTYALSMEERMRRAHALIRSALYTFVQPNGAMRSAQAPHILGVSGVITTSRTPIPAPTISPLQGNYRNDIGNTVEMLNRIEGGEVVNFYDFSDMSGLAEISSVLLQELDLYQYKV